MATFQSFEEIEAWQKARVLTRRIYIATNQGSFSKDFGLRDQIRRASVSIMSNIAEGCERSGTGEFVQFLATARGSLCEMQTQLEIARNLGYLEAENFTQLDVQSREVGRIINGLIKAVRVSPAS